MENIKELIKVGLSSPKLYKRSCWNQAVKVMNYLAENFKDQIVKRDMGPGREKYLAIVDVTLERLSLWTLSYMRHIGSPISVTDAFCELQVIAREMKVKVSDAKVLDEYFRRHPKDILNNY